LQILVLVNGEVEQRGHIVTAESSQIIIVEEQQLQVVWLWAVHQRQGAFKSFETVVGEIQVLERPRHLR
jgi:hypothetical protein